MPTLSGIYDSYGIQPVARINENLSIWTAGHYEHFIIAYSEPIPPGPASQVDMCAIAGAALAANGAIAKRIVPILQLNQYEFLHVRWEPIDNVVGLVWELAGQQRNATRNIFSQVDRMTRSLDPTLALTTFFILGNDKDMNLECRNPMAYAIPMARFQFFGHRLLLTPMDLGVKISQHLDRTRYGNDRTTEIARIKQLLWVGDRDAVRDVIGATTYVPAEGKQL